MLYDYKHLRLLTVGDGDLSCSLALRKAYPLIEILVVTTLLPSEADLLDTYPNSESTLEELLEYRNVSIYYGVDATQLHLHQGLLMHACFDIICFHHPHLGYCDTNDVQSNTAQKSAMSLKIQCEKEESNDPSLASRHACLLAHYLYSATSLFAATQTKSEKVETERQIQFPCVHLCLCGGAVESWDLNNTAKRLNLEYIWDSPFPASGPIFSFLDKLDACSELNSGMSPTAPIVAQRLSACRRGKRKGHWLGKYGYRHQPTFPDSTLFKSNISSSYHIFLKHSLEQNGEEDATTTCAILTGDSTQQFCCKICDWTFVDGAGLEAHQRSPVIPKQKTALYELSSTLGISSKK